MKEANEELVKVFEDTKIKTEKYNESFSVKLCKDDLLPPGHSGSNPYNVKVINTDMVTLLPSLKGRICILNMASYKRPGGGVARGARAQEECLFRCSNLFHVVPKEFYPLHLDRGIYTQNAVFIKDFYYNDMEPVVTDVVTVAAINLREEAFHNPKAYMELLKDKVRLMMSAAASHGVDHLVLGAWGCGVFKNDPELIANVFLNRLSSEKFASHFKSVTFAVIDDHNSVGNNYEIFKRVLE